MEPSSSPRFSLNLTDIGKILRGALIVALGAFCVEFLTQIEAVIDGGLDFGQLDMIRPVATSVLASALEAVRRFFVNYR